MIEDSHSFVYGVISGVVFMVIVGWVASQRRDNRFRAGRASRNVSVEGSQSPRDIVQTSFIASACATFWAIIMLLSFAILAAFLYWVWQL